MLGLVNRLARRDRRSQIAIRSPVHFAGCPKNKMQGRADGRMGDKPQSILAATQTPTPRGRGRSLKEGRPCISQRRRHPHAAPGQGAHRWRLLKRRAFGHHPDHVICSRARGALRWLSACDPNPQHVCRGQSGPSPSAKACRCSVSISACSSAMRRLRCGSGIGRFDGDRSPSARRSSSARAAACANTAAVSLGQDDAVVDRSR